MRVLVVEDELAIADFVRRGLEAEGYAVACAHDGESGEVQAVTGDFALVLLDVMLPGKNGVEVLRAVRHFEDERHQFQIALFNRDYVEVVARLERGKAYRDQFRRLP